MRTPGIRRDTTIWDIEAPEEVPPALEHEDTTTAQANAVTSPANRISG